MRLKLRFIIFFTALLVFSLFRGTVLAADFKVTGTAIDGKNNPVVNAKITVMDVLTQRTITTTNSDQNGYYTLFVPKGTYNIVTSPPAGSNIPATTYSHITIASDLSLHNNMNTETNNSSNTTAQNAHESSPKKGINFLLLIVFLVVIVAAVLFIRVSKKKNI